MTPIFGGYARILRGPQTPRMVTAMFVGRLPNGMFPLGVVFVLQGSSGSYSAAGAALAALMIGTTCSAPFRGRAVDRWGPSRTLIPLVLGQSVAMAGFLVAVTTDQSPLVVIPLVAAVGAMSSTLGGAMRRTWPTLVRPTDLPTAYALQAVLEDLIAVAGPLIASLLLVVASSTTILIFAEVAAVTGATVFAAARVSRSDARRRVRPSSALGALGTPGMRTLTLTILAAGMAVGMLYIEVPAFVQRGDHATAGILLAVMAASSMVSGLWYGARAWVSSVDRRYVWLAGLFAAAVALLVLADTPAQLGAALALVGIAYAPRIISAYLLLDDLAPRDAVTEAYTWLVSASAAGVASGSAMAGPLVQHAGTRWAFAGTGTCAIAGYALVIARRRTLTPRAR